MQVIVCINCNSAAFENEDDRASELARIFSHVATLAQAGLAPSQGPVTLRDYNGNKCGTMRFVLL